MTKTKSISIVGGVEHAVILAAGLGSRLAPLTDEQPKAMVSMLGEPTLHRTLRQFAEAGLKEATVIVGHQADYVKRRTGSRFEGVDVRYVFNSEYASTGTAASLLCAEPYLRRDSLIIEGDVLFDSALLSSILAQPTAYDVAAIALFEPPLSGTVVHLEAEGTRIRSFVRSVPSGAMSGVFKTVNIYRFQEYTLRQCILPALAEFRTTQPTAYFEDVLSALTVHGKLDLRAVDCSHHAWFEVDDLNDLRLARERFGNESRSSSHGQFN